MAAANEANDANYADVKGMERLRSDLWWSLEESHEIMVWFACPAQVADLPREEQLRCWCIRYNIFYHILVVGTAACIIAGKWVHGALGQGGPVREDELPVEKEARILWIYATDGPMVVSAGVSMLWLLWVLRKGDPIRTNLVDLAVDACYVGGNVYFLEALKMRNVLLIRLAIVSNATFAIGLLALLLFQLSFTDPDLFNDDETNDLSLAQHWITWLLRVVVVLFAVFATACYLPLWSAHGTVLSCVPSCDAGLERIESGASFESNDDDDLIVSSRQRHLSSSTERRRRHPNWVLFCRHYSAIVSAAILVWFLLGFLVLSIPEGDSAIWDALL